MGQTQNVIIALLSFFSTCYSLQQFEDVTKYLQIQGKRILAKFYRYAPVFGVCDLENRCLPQQIENC